MQKECVANSSSINKQKIPCWRSGYVRSTACVEIFLSVGFCCFLVSLNFNSPLTLEALCPAPALFPVASQGT